MDLLEELEKERLKRNLNSKKWYAKNKEKAKEASKNWAKANPERRAKKMVQWAKNNPEKIYFAQIKIKYGITREEYDAMYKEQDGKCYLCERGDRKLSVDHCHKTKKIRRLTCRQCNSGMGMFGDDPVLLRKAADYLEK